MEERLGTILVSIIKKIKLKAIKLKLVGVKCNKKKLNIKILGVFEDIFKEIMEKLFSELKTKLNLQIQRASREIRSMNLNTKTHFS